MIYKSATLWVWMERTKRDLEKKNTRGNHRYELKILRSKEFRDSAQVSQQIKDKFSGVLEPAYNDSRDPVERFSEILQACCQAQLFLNAKLYKFRIKLC